MKTIYTDASCDPITNHGVLGFMVDDKIYTSELDNIKNTDAEMTAIVYALSNIIQTDDQIILYTDCQRAIKLFQDKKITKPIHQIVINKFNQFNNITLVHIDGHKKASLKTKTDREFSKLDQHLRKKLRDYMTTKM